MPFVSEPLLILNADFTTEGLEIHVLPGQFFQLLLPTPAPVRGHLLVFQRAWPSQSAAVPVFAKMSGI